MTKFYRCVSFLVLFVFCSGFITFADIESKNKTYYNFDTQNKFSYGHTAESPSGDYEGDMSFKVPYEGDEGIEDNCSLFISADKLAVLTFDFYFDKFSPDTAFRGWRIVQGSEARGPEGDYTESGANWVQLGSASKAADSSGQSAHLRDSFGRNTDYVLKNKTWYTMRYTINCDNGTIKCFIAPKGETLIPISFKNGLNTKRSDYFDEYTSYQSGGRGYDNIKFTVDENGKKISYTHGDYSEKVSVFQIFKNIDESRTSDVYFDNFYVESYDYLHEYATGLTNENIDGFFNFNNEFGFLKIPEKENFDLSKLKDGLLNRNFSSDDEFYLFCNEFFKKHMTDYDGSSLIYDLNFNDENDAAYFISDAGLQTLEICSGINGYGKMLRVTSADGGILKFDGEKYSSCADAFYEFDMSVFGGSYSFSAYLGSTKVFEIKNGIPQTVSDGVSADFSLFDTKFSRMKIVLNQKTSDADVYLKVKDAYIKIYSVKSDALSAHDAKVLSFDISAGSEFYIDSASLRSYPDLYKSLRDSAYKKGLYSCIKKYIGLNFECSISEKFEYLSEAGILKYLQTADFSSVGSDAECSGIINEICEKAFDDTMNSDYEYDPISGFKSNFSSAELFNTKTCSGDFLSGYIADVSAYAADGFPALDITCSANALKNGKVFSVSNSSSEISGGSIIIDMKKYHVRSCYAADFYLDDLSGACDITVRANAYNGEHFDYEILRLNSNGSAGLFGKDFKNVRKNGHVRYSAVISQADGIARLYADGVLIGETGITLPRHILQNAEIEFGSFASGKKISFENIGIYEIENIASFNEKNCTPRLYSSVYDIDSENKVIYVDSYNIKTSVFKSVLFSDNDNRTDILTSDNRTKFTGGFINSSAVVRVFSPDRISYSDYSVKLKNLNYLNSSAVPSLQKESAGGRAYASKPELMYDGDAVGYFTVGKYSAKAAVKNSGGSDVNCVLAAAVYSGNKMTDVYFSEKNKINAGEEKSLECSVNVTSDSAERIKIFVLDISDAMRPLSECAQYTQNPQKGITKDELLNLYMKNSYNVHPKIFASDYEWNRLSDNLKNDSVLIKRHGDIIKRADQMLSSITFDPGRQNESMYIGYKMITGDRLLTIANRVVDCSYTLGYAYRTTGDEKYADMLWQIYKRAGYTENADAETKQEFPDWHPSHYLDTAEMTHGFSVGLDWLYGYWNAEQRAFLQKSIAEYGIKPCFNSDTGNAKDMWWMSADTNWNAVCCGGMIIGSISLLDSDEYRDMALEVLHKNLLEIRNSLHHFSPDGGWGEGIGYWDYQMRYLTYAMTTVKNTFKTDFGYLNINGIKKTGLYAMYMMGPGGKINNYHDNSEKYYGSFVMFYLSDVFDNPIYASLWNKNIEKYGRQISVTDMLLYDSEAANSEFSLSNTGYFADAEVFSMRDEWDSDGASFLSAHAGRNDEGHSHYDCGTFVYDGNGIRWALDLGSEDYTVPEYFGNSRYKYYRIRTEGHNCLVINPSDSGAGQEYKCSTEVVEQNGRKKNPYYIMDLTDAYKSDVSDYRRGTMLLGSDGFLIRDELRLKNDDSTVYWFMHTKGDVKVLDNNRVELTQGNEKMILTFDTNAKIEKLDVTDAKSLVYIDPDLGVENYPYSDDSNANSGVRKIMLKITAPKDTYINAKCVSASSENDYDLNSGLSHWKCN